MDDWLSDWLPDYLYDWLAGWLESVTLLDWLTDWLTVWFTDSLTVDSLTYWLIHCLTGQLTVWLADCLTTGWLSLWLTATWKKIKNQVTVQIAKISVDYDFGNLRIFEIYSTEASENGIRSHRKNKISDLNFLVPASDSVKQLRLRYCVTEGDNLTISTRLWHTGKQIQ